MAFPTLEEKDKTYLYENGQRMFSTWIYLILEISTHHRQNNAVYFLQESSLFCCRERTHLALRHLVNLLLAAAFLQLLVSHGLLCDRTIYLLSLSLPQQKDPAARVPLSIDRLIMFGEDPITVDFLLSAIDTMRAQAYLQTFYFSGHGRRRMLLTL